MLAEPDGGVDLLVGLDVLEHCEDDAASVREAARVLAPGGVFVLTVPALPSLWSQHDVDNAHFRRYTRSTLLEPLRAADFEIERVTYFNSLLLPAAYASRWVARATGSRKALGVDMPSKAVNETMKAVFSLEAALLRTVDLPVGMSLLTVARRKG
jgi:SAM-dependent methyltransferase